MGNTIKIYHNPRCSKSRQTLEILQSRQQSPTVIEYLKTPPTVKELEHILNMLGMEPRQLMRTKEAEYQELDLDNDKLSRKQLIQAMVDHPKLIERPIVIHNNKAVIGRPPEKILEII